MTEDYKDWVGRSTEVADVVSPAPLRMMAATLDLDLPQAPSQPLRPLWHWLYFLPTERQSNIGADGHPKRGGFLPRVALPRRMWAGGRLRFERAIQPGTEIRRLSRIASVERKSGKSGDLVFVCVEHEISDWQGLLVHEEHDIVYRGAPDPGAPPPAARPARTDEQFGKRVKPDPVLLFRYSALTFNGHRIHYDAPYVTGEEHYPGLVVHGPLIATLLVELLQAAHPGFALMSFEFKAVSPLFHQEEFEVCGRLEGDVATLWARGAKGQLAMQATARVRGGEQA